MKEKYVELSMNIKFKLWQSPNFVVPLDESKPKSIGDFSDDDLKRMAKAWLDDLLEKAGRIRALEKLP